MLVGGLFHVFRDGWLRSRLHKRRRRRRFRILRRPWLNRHGVQQACMGWLRQHGGNDGGKAHESAYTHDESPQRIAQKSICISPREQGHSRQQHRGLRAHGIAMTAKCRSVRAKQVDYFSIWG
jgi:hypothetical protein